MSGAVVAVPVADCTVSASVEVCLRLPEVAVKVTVGVAAVALPAAESVVFWDVPGVSVSVAGLAVTLDGRPVMAIATLPVKEFNGVARTLIAEPVWPPMRVNDVGEMLREKSGTGAAAETVKARVAEWLSEPEVPVNVRVLLPVAAVDEAVRVMFCEVPGVSERVVGLALTPVGNPVMARETVPVKEFTEVARTLTCVPVAPAIRVSEVGERESEKPGAGAAAVMVAATAAV